MRSTDNFWMGASLWSRYRIAGTVVPVAVVAPTVVEAPEHKTTFGFEKLFIELGELAWWMKLLREPDGWGCWKTIEPGLFVDEMTFWESDGLNKEEEDAWM